MAITHRCPLQETTEMTLMAPETLPAAPTPSLLGLPVPSGLQAVCIWFSSSELLFTRTALSVLYYRALFEGISPPLASESLRFERISRVWIGVCVVSQWSSHISRCGTKKGKETLKFLIPLYKIVSGVSHVFDKWNSTQKTPTTEGYGMAYMADDIQTTLNMMEVFKRCAAGCWVLCRKEHLPRRRKFH